MRKSDIDSDSQGKEYLMRSELKSRATRLFQRKLREDFAAIKGSIVSNSDVDYDVLVVNGVLGVYDVTDEQSPVLKTKIAEFSKA